MASTTTITIEQVSADLDAWRHNKESGGTRIPAHLVIMIQNLVPKYDKRLIIRSLKISPKLFDYDMALADFQLGTPEPIDFVPYSMASVDQPETYPNNDAKEEQPKFTKEALTFHCEIIKPSGVKLIIHHPDPNMIMSIFLCSN